VRGCGAQRGKHVGGQALDLARPVFPGGDEVERGEAEPGEMPDAFDDLGGRPGNRSALLPSWSSTTTWVFSAQVIEAGSRPARSAAAATRPSMTASASSGT
jgi:hypothetical protein